MISVKDVYMLLDEKYPYCIQEDYDNSGIMADCGKSIEKIVISLDITNSVVDFAVSQGAQLIVSHHPIIFHPVRSISYNSPLQNLLSSGISAISAHTNFDIADGGVNDALANKLGLKNIEPVFLVSEKNVKGVIRKNYIGRAGNLPDSMLPAEFAAYVTDKLRGRTSAEFVDGGRPVRRVAVGGGACGEFIFECNENRIDAFVTGECKHHELLYAKENGITLIAAGHYATENVALEALASTLQNGFPDVEVIITRIDDPVSFTE